MTMSVLPPLLMTQRQLRHGASLPGSISLTAGLERVEISRYEVTRLREQRGWRQADLAAATGLSRPFVSQIESGEREPSEITVQAIADALGVEVAELQPRTCPRCGAPL